MARPNAFGQINFLNNSDFGSMFEKGTKYEISSAAQHIELHLAYSKQKIFKEN